MKLFACWLVSLVVGFVALMWAAVLCVGFGRPDLGAAFQRCAVAVLVIGGVVSIVTLAVIVWVRLRAGRWGAGAAPAPLRDTAGQHGTIKSRRV